MSKIVNGSEYVEGKKKTTPYMSIYEYSALIYARCVQLSFPNTFPLIPLTELGSYDTLVIATEEVKRRLPNLVIRRTLDDGTTEDWLLSDKKNPMVFPHI